MTQAGNSLAAHDVNSLWGVFLIALWLSKIIVTMRLKLSSFVLMGHSPCIITYVIPCDFTDECSFICKWLYAPSWCVCVDVCLPGRGLGGGGPLVAVTRGAVNSLVLKYQNFIFLFFSEGTTAYYFNMIYVWKWITLVYVLILFNLSQGWWQCRNMELQA